MSALGQLELKNDCSCFCPVGEVSFAEAVNLVSEAMRLACDQGVEKLLVDITGLTGFDSPTTLPRFFAAERLAAEATLPIKCVMVCRPEFLRPDRYAVMIARNRGLLCNVFATESEALDWLLGPETGFG